MSPKLVKKGAYIRHFRKLFRIEAVRDIGDRREILVENARDESLVWMPEELVLSFDFVCQGRD